MDELPSPLVLHEDPVSGNGYKIRLTAALLGIPLERRLLRHHQGRDAHRTVPGRDRCQWPHPGAAGGNRFLPESNAACFYLADGSQLIPADRFERAAMLRWMFFEQYQHEPNIATMRYWLHVLDEANLSSRPARRDGDEAQRRRSGTGADGPAPGGARLVRGRCGSLADIALFAYTHVAHEGGFSLDGYPAIRGWITACLPCRVSPPM